MVELHNSIATHLRLDNVSLGIGALSGGNMSLHKTREKTFETCLFLHTKLEWNEEDKSASERADGNMMNFV